MSTILALLRSLYTVSHTDDTMGWLYVRQVLLSLVYTGFSHCGKRNQGCVQYQNVCQLNEPFSDGICQRRETVFGYDSRGDKNGRWYQQLKLFMRINFSIFELDSHLNYVIKAKITGRYDLHVHEPYIQYIYSTNLRHFWNVISVARRTQQRFSMEKHFWKTGKTFFGKHSASNAVQKLVRAHIWCVEWESG